MATVIEPTRDEIVELVENLSYYLDEIGKYFDEHGYEPSPDSQAEHELNSSFRQQSLLTAYCQGGLLIQAAADHMMAFIKTITEPIQTIAPWTCIRALMEASALACWLLEPKIDPKTRLQRSFAYRYEGLREQQKYLMTAGYNKEADQINKRIAEVEADALNLGYNRIQNNKGKTTGIGQQMPSITDLIKFTLNDEETYRVLSAAIHAHNWALINLSFKRIHGEKISCTSNYLDDEKLYILEKHMSTISVAFLCKKAAYYFTRPVLLKCKLFGWNSEKLIIQLTARFSRFTILNPLSYLGDLDTIYPHE